ncbi:DUF1761 family protein [Tabrizicola oligotrophica]|uniref:DUF1761 domain-containing protein n=1 Tax=Tabrizicola oligotrophica TaxID=2710650 RepID=A0A6M0QTS6_9RHOB|nr:DUF1761 family protein [Tabrizicola oligotrophica]NEY89852.1 hypothetical protein [Tabrizicola oligotrophica]
MFEGVNWLAVGLGFVLSFGFGWFYYGPKGFYPAWSASAGVRHQPGDPMGAAFGSLVVGLVLYSVFVGVMVARGMTGPLILGVIAFIVMGYSNNAFKKLGPASRAIDAGSWAASGVLMLLAQGLL